MDTILKALLPINKVTSLVAYGHFDLGPINLGQKKAPSNDGAFLAVNSLTMTYFHTGTRTIIGADAFHCPVRDGKEWYHVAMVVRHKLFVWLTEVNRTNL